MALFSDLLPYILQQQQTALPGGPNLGPAIPRSPTNVTAMNMPSAKLPGAFDFANSANNFANVMGENVLRQQQAHLANLNAQHVGYQISLIPEFRKALDEWMNRSSGASGGGTGAGGSEQGGSLLGSSTRSSGGVATPSDGGTYWTPEGLAALRPTEGRYDQIHYPSGDPSTASGAYGFLDNTWREQAAKAGVDITKWSRAYMAPPAVQDMVAAQTPIHHWTGVDANGKPFNANAQRLATNPAYVTGGKQTAAAPATGGQTITVPSGPTPAAEAPWAPGDMSQYTRPGDKGGPITVEGVTYPSRSAWNRAMDAQATVTAQQPGAAIPVTPQGEIPEVPSYKGTMGETPAAEDNDAALVPDESPGFAGRALAGQMQGNENLSLIDRLNQQMIAQLGGGQVAGEGAPSGGMSGAALPGILAGQMPTPTLPGRDPSLSMPFNPAAQAAAGPSPAVPSAPAGGPPKPPAGTPGGQGFQLDPMQAQMLKLGMLGQLSGMGNLTAPLEKAFYESPEFAARRAAATTGATHSAAYPWIVPETTAKTQTEKDISLRMDPQIAGATEEAKAGAALRSLIAQRDRFPVGSANYNLLNNAVIKQSGVDPQQIARPDSSVITQGPQGPQVALITPTLRDRMNPDQTMGEAYVGSGPNGPTVTPVPGIVKNAPWLPGTHIDPVTNREVPDYRLPPGPGQAAGTGFPMGTSFNPGGTPGATPTGGTTVNAPVPAAGPTPPTTIQAPGFVKFSPEEEASYKSRGEHLEFFGKQVDEDAIKAAQQRTTLANMENAVQRGFAEGKLADARNTAASYLRLIDPSWNGQVSDYEDYSKNLGTVTRQAVRETSARAAVQEFTMIANALPEPSTSPQGKRQMLNELVGNEQFKMAKQQAQQQWRDTHNQSLRGFEQDFSRNLSPYAFIIARMEAPAVAQTFAAMNKTQAGLHDKAIITRQLQYLHAHPELEGF